MGNPGDVRIAVGAIGNPVSAASYGSVGADQGYDVVVDKAGNIIVVGTFEGSVSFGGKMVTSKGGIDAFVVSLGPGGSTRWALGLGSAAGEDRAQGVAVDAMGNIYVCGLFVGTVDFGGQQRTAAGSWDAFLVSYDTNGVLRWSRSAGGTGADFAYDVAVDPAGDVLLTGYYEGSAVSFGPNALPAFGTRDTFLVKYAADGGVKWAQGFGSGGSDSGYGVAADATGNIVLGAGYAGPTNFGSGLVGTAVPGSVIVKLGPDGRGLAWAQPFAGTTLWDLDVDRASGRIVVASRVSTGADLGQGPITPPGGDDALVMSLDASGKLQWYDVFGGTLSDVGLGITIDAFGNSYAIGLGGSSIDFGAGVGVLTGQGDQDVFVVSHAAAGAPRWARLFGGGAQDRGYGVAVAPAGGVYVTGRYAGTALFGPGLSHASAGGDDVFLVKLE